MRTVHVSAWAWEQAGLATAFRTEFRILSAHSVHIRRRCTDVRNVSGEAGKVFQTLDFLYDGILAAGLYELALMCGYSTEVTTSETASMGIYRELDHLECRNVLSLISRMRKFGEREIPERIHLFLGCRRPGRVYLDITVSYRLHKYRRLEHIGICLDNMEILGKGNLILTATLIGVKNDSILCTATSVHIEAQLRYLPDFIYITS